MSQRVYRTSPFGEAIYPHINKPDFKWNDKGVYKFGLSLGGPEAIKFKELVDAEVEASAARFWESDDGKKVLPKDKKHWKVKPPYKIDEDDEGNPTGYIVFNFKQNFTLKLKDGTIKEVKIGIKDASGSKEVAVPIFGGSELRALFGFRDTVMASLKQISVQLAFAQVQVRKLGTMSIGRSFDAVEGYEVPDDDDNGADSPLYIASANSHPAAGGGDF